MEITNFDKKLNFGEDIIAAAHMLLVGYKTAYCAEAQVYHAHSYSCAEEFRRYKATGVFHKQQYWLLEKFGKAEWERLKFVLSETRYLLNQGKWYLLPLMCLRTIFKYTEYKSGTGIH